MQNIRTYESDGEDGKTLPKIKHRRNLQEFKIKRHKDKSKYDRSKQTDYYDPELEGQPSAWKQALQKAKEDLAVLNRVIEKERQDDSVQPK